MGPWKEWILDISNWPTRCYCPMDGDDIVTGMNLIQDDPPGPLVGVFHPGGQEAVEDMLETHREEIKAIVDRSRL